MGVISDEARVFAGRRAMHPAAGQASYVDDLSRRVSTRLADLEPSLAQVGSFGLLKAWLLLST